MHTGRVGTIHILCLFLASTSLSYAGADVPATGGSEARTVMDFDPDWRFSKGDFANAMSPGFDDTAWRPLDVPHDWSSEGPFSGEYGSGNGYAPGGIGWYRKHFTLDESQKHKVVVVEFDGVYDYAEVWINGQYVGGRPYGYSSFECGLTPLVKFGSGDNVLAVRVDHSRFADSRWYTGSGIYRHVRLCLTDTLHVAHWGTYVTTPEVTADATTVRVETTLENSSLQPGAFSLQSEIIAPDGQTVGSLSTSGKIAEGTNQVVVQQIKLARPQLWSPSKPVLYALRTRLSNGAAVVDETATPFGIRTLHFDPDKGFFLNGESMKIKGVCIHHDAGSLGAAVPDQVLERRLRILKKLGVNAIRTSHNPPAPELLEMCDRLGLLVKDEAFDEFMPAKNKWVTGRNNGEASKEGYAELFDRWSVTDIQDMVRRDRNHPCVIMWSIGNEIDYRNDPFSNPVLGNEYRPANPHATDLVKCAAPLITAVHALDTTRPVTSALATVSMSDTVGFGELLDIDGYNYQEDRYAADHLKYPKRFIFGSENYLTLAAWLAVKTNDYVGGQFLWTGIDYLGEANRWPNRGSSAGLLDVCGFKKPNAWFRQSLWSDQPMVYLCAAVGGGFGRGGGGGAGGAQESWNWSSNATVTIRCYTTCQEVTLTLNDQPLGSKQLADAVQGTLTWQVPFQPGVLKAVGHSNGKPDCEFVLKTAGPAGAVALLPEVTKLRANGKDVSCIEFRVVDDQGVRVPNAAQELTFTVEGPGKLIDLDNGDLNTPESGKDGKRHVLRGHGLAIVQATREPGRIRLTAKAEGLKDATVEIDAQ